MELNKIYSFIRYNLKESFHYHIELNNIVLLDIIGKRSFYYYIELNNVMKKQVKRFWD